MPMCDVCGLVDGGHDVMDRIGTSVNWQRRVMVVSLTMDAAVMIRC